MSSAQNSLAAHADPERELLQLLADSASFAVAYLNNERGFELVNSAFKIRFGSPGHGASAGDFFAGVCSPAVDQYLETAIIRAAPLKARLDCSNQYGATERLRFQAVPHVTDNGVNGAFVLFEDIETRTVAPSEDHETENERLTHLQRMAKLGEMAAGLAHEVRQPLGAIGNYANAAIRMLRNGSSGEEVVALVSRIAEQTERAGRVMANIRHLTGTGRHQFSRVDMSEVLSESLDLVERRARELNIDIRASVQASQALVWGDPSQIEQILVNLITNAVDAMSECDPRIMAIDLDASATSARVRVRDTGSGVPEQALESIFNPFETSKSDGMGMGLAISRALAQRHGGKLWAETGSADGAIFVLELPLAEKTVDSSGDV